MSDIVIPPTTEVYATHVILTTLDHWVFVRMADKGGNVCKTGEQFDESWRAEQKFDDLCRFYSKAKPLVLARADQV